MLSTSQAAKLLGVSARRVTALIAAGELDAEKIGGTWLVDEASLQKRLDTPRLKGRPRGGERDQRKIEDYTLMCENEPVFDFCYNDSRKTVVSISNIRQPQLAPVGACAAPNKPGLTPFSEWLSERYIPHNRIDIERLLAASGLDGPEALMFQSLGLNLTDQFWFCPKGVEIDWHDVSFFENDYADDREAKGPGSGTPGMLPKWWERRDGDNVLVKAAGMAGREPFAELAATLLYGRLLDKDDFVPYRIEAIDNAPHSVCPSFIGPDEQLVTMRDVRRCYRRRMRGDAYTAYRDVLEELGVPQVRESLAKMIVCDFLDANIDRHDMNLGVVRGRNGGFLRIAPLFDNGRCFYFAALRPGDFTDGLYHHISQPFSEYPTAQLACAEDYAWFDPDCLDGFANELAETLSGNDLAPAWFPEAAAKQFTRQLRLAKETAREHIRHPA